jgi:hypothetical protein
MRYLMLGALLSTAAIGPAAAATTTLTFDRNETACAAADDAPATQACTADGQFVGSNYGSTAQLAVSYDASESTGSRNSLQHTSDFFFTSNDGQATSPFPGDELSEIIFTPAAGYEVSFRSFAWDKLTATSSSEFIFKVFDPNGNELFSAGNAELTYMVNTAYFTGPLTFAFGNGGRGAVAVDDIVVDVRAAANAVPEPASWAMLIAGFALAGSAARRRSRTAVLA